MVTDQMQTGVPSGNAFKTQGINQRTQIVKPTQVANLGRSMPQNQNLSASVGVQANQNTTTPKFNPLRPNTQNKASTPSTPSVQAAPSTASTKIPIQAQAQTQTQSDIVRSAIRKMSDSELVGILDEIANGSLRGGM